MHIKNVLPAGRHIRETDHTGLSAGTSRRGHTGTADHGGVALILSEICQEWLGCGGSSSLLGPEPLQWPAKASDQRIDRPFRGLVVGPVAKRE